jgi:hypothetical protein
VLSITVTQVSVILPYVLLGASDQDDDILEMVEEDDGTSRQLEPKKRKTDSETEGGMSKKLRTEDVVMLV